MKGSTQIAYRGRHGCDSPVCTRTLEADSLNMCYGWHCAVCHKPSSHQGHPFCHSEQSTVERARVSDIASQSAISDHLASARSTTSPRRIP